MPKTPLLQGNFSRGELSPRSLGRPDYEAWQRAAQSLENFIVLLEGGLMKRYGTRYIATAGVPTNNVRLSAFIFRTVDALVLEWGHEYVRFYKNTAPVMSGLSPYQVTTPYAGTHLHELRFEQKNDVIYITHISYAPRKLQRIADNNWQLSTANPYPPPTQEVGRKPAVQLTLGATTGNNVSCTAASGVFLASDVDREIVSGAGRAIIRSFTSATVVNLRILDAFSSTTLASGNWTLTASPVAQLKPSKKEPRGATVTLDLRQVQDSATELVTTGSSDLTGWTDVSGGVLVSGQHDGANDSDELTDAGTNFQALGVFAGQLVFNTTDGSSGTIHEIMGSTLSLTGMGGGTDNDFDTNDAYEIRKTGSAKASDGGITLNGGLQGVGAVRRSITTVAGTAYRATFTVSGQPMSFMVGSTAGNSDLKSENSYGIKDEPHVVIFVATGTTTWLEFRNNQPHDATVKNVSMKIYSIDGWRSTDVGSYVYVHGGLVRLVEFTSARSMEGQLIHPLTSDAEAAVGSWTLEDPAWTAANGYPGQVRLHQQRMVFASSPTFPQHIWGTVSGDLENFLRTGTADGAFTFQIADAQGLLYWLISTKNLLIGAENSEYRMAGAGGGAIDPTAPPDIDPFGEDGAGNVEALRVGNSILMVTRQGSQLLEITYDAEAEQGYVIDDLTLVSGHLLETGRIRQQAYAHAPIPLLLEVRSDGVLLVCTYRKRDKIGAWSRFVLASDAADTGFVRSATVIPHPTANAYQIWLVSNRTINGSATRYIEVIDDVAVGVDSAVVYSGAATDTVTGLDHLVGEVVQVAAIPSGGSHYANYGTFTVESNGEVDLGEDVTAYYAGLPYAAEAVTLSPEIPGVPTLQTTRKRWVDVFGRVRNTGVGLTVNGKAIRMSVGSDVMDDGLPLYTGDFRETAFGWGKSGTLTLRHDLPLPCELLLLGGSLEVGDMP